MTMERPPQFPAFRIVVMLVVLVNLGVDLLARWLDPRVRHAVART